MAIIAEGDQRAQTDAEKTSKLMAVSNMMETDDDTDNAAAGVSLHASAYGDGMTVR